MSDEMSELGFQWRLAYDGDIDRLHLRLMAALERYLLFTCCCECAARQCYADKIVELHCYDGSCLVPLRASAYCYMAQLAIVQAKEEFCTTREEDMPVSGRAMAPLPGIDSSTTTSRRSVHCEILHKATQCPLYKACRLFGWNGCTNMLFVPSDPFNILLRTIKLPQCRPTLTYANDKACAPVRIRTPGMIRRLDLDLTSTISKRVQLSKML